MIKALPIVIFVATLLGKSMLNAEVPIEYETVKTNPMDFKVTEKSPQSRQLNESLGISVARIQQLNQQVNVHIERLLSEGKYVSKGQTFDIIAHYCDTPEEFAYSCFSFGVTTVKESLFSHPNKFKRLIIRRLRLV